MTKTYIGTKTVKGYPMNRLDYNIYRGWELPADEDGSDEGYLVEYIDGGKANDSRHAGYISRSPKEVFERAYKEVRTLTYGYVCGATCQPGDEHCNGYCENKAKSSGTYTVRLMTFGEAVEQLKAGKKVARSGWNGKGMFLFLVPGSTFKVNRAPLLGIYPEGTEINYCPHIDMKTADGKIVPWLASQTDVLGEDWVLV